MRMAAPLALRRAALLAAGALAGGAAAYLHLRRAPAPAPAAVPAHPIAGPAPAPHTLVTPAGTRVLAPRHAELLKYGLPNAQQLQLKANYVSLVDYRLREPVWVLEHLTRDNLRGGADRAGTGFTQDHDVPKLFRQSNDDYLKSGYSRGHMAPASNNKGSADAMKESFLLNSNIVPQDLDNNMFYWNRMEQWVKHLVTKKGFDSVRVLSGPLFLPSALSPDGQVIDANPHNLPAVPGGSGGPPYFPPASAITCPPPSDVYSPPPPGPEDTTTSMVPGKPFRYVTYKTIGETGVAVPTHLYKAVLAEKDQGKDKPPAVFFAAFIVPNGPIREDVELSKFQVSKEVLEKYAGIQVYDRAFDMLRVTDLCSVQDPTKGNRHSMCMLESAAEFKFFTLEREMSKVRSRADADRVWAEAQKASQKYSMPVPQSVVAAYERVGK